MELPKYVEVETSRRCNRTCGWCPNGEHDARRVQQLMDWDLFTRIIEQLAELDYGGYLAFHNYNEPLLSRRILDEIRHVKAAVPQAKPAIYTPPSIEAIKQWLHRKGLSDMLPWQFGPVRQGPAALCESASVKVEVIAPKILDAYNNRGGSVTMLPVLAKARTQPCLMTATSAVIDYAGRMKMCCCVYPDTEGHEQYIVGDLTIETFAELWGEPAMKARRDAHARADWSLSPACASCTQPLPETRR